MIEELRMKGNDIFVETKDKNVQNGLVFKKMKGFHFLKRGNYVLDLAEPKNSLFKPI